MQAFFLAVDGGPQGQRFALYHSPHGAVRALIVYVHPFAEEMNKSRRMAAIQSRRLAEAGYAVLQLDLLGCGDSAGDIGEATWSQWVADVAHACRWLRGQWPAPAAARAASPPLWLWGLRAGCLLAVEAAGQLDEPCQFLFWQPATAGKALLQQFLRLKVAGEMFGEQSKGVMTQLRRDLAAGKSVEVAGYVLQPALCDGLEQATLRPPGATGGVARRVEWLEVSAADGATLSPAAELAQARWRDAGWLVRSQVVPGPAFWQTIEIEDAPALLTATLTAVDSEARP